MKTLKAVIGIMIALLLGASQEALAKVTIEYPYEKGLASDNLFVRVTVYSVYEIASVKASVNDRTADLKHSGHVYWEGVLSLAGLPRQEMTLTVTATDARGTTETVQRTIFHDNPPVLTITSPGNYPNPNPRAYDTPAAVRASIQLKATCTDDGPDGCTIEVKRSDTGLRVAIGRNSLDQTIPFESGQKALDLVFFTTDSMNHASHVSVLFRTVIVNPHPNYIVEETVPGTILDVQPDRILFLNGQRRFYIRDRETDADTLIDTSSLQGVPFIGRLTPRGALLLLNTATGPDQPPLPLYDWRDGQFIPLGSVTGPSLESLRVKGRYAVWMDGAALVRRDLETGENVTVTQGAGFADVAENGDVVYWTTNRTYRYRSGETTVIMDTPNNRSDPLTDGSLIVYRKFDGLHSIAMWDGTGETILSTYERTNSNIPIERLKQYQVNNGWVAFTRLGNTAQTHLWLRSPQGVLKRLSFFAFGQIEILDLSPQGEVLFRLGMKLYLGGFLRESELDLGLSEYTGVRNPFTVRGFWQGGKWHAIIGDTLFSLATESCESRVKGDVTRDGAVDVADAVGVLRAIVGAGDPAGECDRRVMDVNCDGAVQVDDVVGVLRRIVLDEAFPACP